MTSVWIVRLRHTPAAMSHEIDLEVPRLRFAPIPECAHRNTLADLSDPLSFSSRSGLISDRRQQSINRCRTCQQEESLHFSIQVQVSVALQRSDQIGHNHFQPFPANPITRLSNHDEGLSHRFIVNPLADSAFGPSAFFLSVPVGPHVE